MARFALLEHTQRLHRHWDLLLTPPGGRGQSLWSFQIHHEPPWRGVRELLRLPDHRPIYLQYEGPIQGSRGHVRRVDSGPIRFHRCSEDRLHVWLGGRSLRGLWKAVLAEPLSQRWHAEWDPR